MEKKYMQIPRGKAGKTLIAEVTRLIRLFNSSKRWESVAIHMLQVLLHNSYNIPAMLYLENGDHILSQEGVTQGDNAAMAMYALSTRPLIQAFSNETANDEVKQV